MVQRGLEQSSDDDSTHNKNDDREPQNQQHMYVPLVHVVVVVLYPGVLVVGRPVKNHLVREIFNSNERQFKIVLTLGGGPLGGAPRPDMC